MLYRKQSSWSEVTVERALQLRHISVDKNLEPSLLSIKFFRTPPSKRRGGVVVVVINDIAKNFGAMTSQIKYENLHYFVGQIQKSVCY